jgi:hypothetical protein
MAVKKRSKEDIHVRRIHDILTEQYASAHRRARIDVKRYNSVSVRIRIIDPDFSRQTRADRDDAIWQILEKLPEETLTEVTLLLLFTPEEAKKSIMNVEFEDPTPSPF